MTKSNALSPDSAGNARNGVTESDTVSELFNRGLWTRPGFLIRRLHQIHYAIFFEDCKDDNITPVQYGLLSVLIDDPWLDQTEIGYQVGLDRTTSADVIRRLEEKGWVERRVNPSDRRSRQARVTDEGAEVMTTLKNKMVQTQKRLLEPLEESERHVFMDLLKKLVDANNQYGRAVLKSL